MRGARVLKGAARRAEDDKVRRAAVASPHLGASALFRWLPAELRESTALDRVRRIWEEVHGVGEVVEAVEPVAGRVLVEVRAAAAAAVAEYGEVAELVVAIGGRHAGEPPLRLIEGRVGRLGRLVGRTGTRWLVAWPAAWAAELGDDVRIRRDLVIEIACGGG